MALSGFTVGQGLRATAEIGVGGALTIGGSATAPTGAGLVVAAAGVGITADGLVAAAQAGTNAVAAA